MHGFDIVGPGFSAGVATATFTAYKAETGRTLTVKDTTAPQTSTFDGVSPAFTVVPNDPKTLTFSPTPIPETEINKTINNPTGINVLVQDQYGNRAYGVSVNVAVDASSGCIGPDCSRCQRARPTWSARPLRQRRVRVRLT